MAQPETAGIRSNRIGACCLFCLHPHNVDNAGAAAAPHNGRDTPVVQFLSSSGGHNCVQPLAIQVDIGLLDPPGGSLRLHQSLQTRNPFQNADAGITKPMVCTSCDCLHDGIRTAGRCSRHVGVPAFLQKEAGTDREMEITDNLVYVGLSFMTLGMLMGAIWAKEAWGHYWAWDPKETWAAITWLSYLVYIHYRLYRPRSIRPSLWLIIIAFCLLQMCWWGINYLPSAQGMSVHTYNLT